MARKRTQSLTRRGDHTYIIPNLLQQDFTATVVSPISGQEVR